MSVNNGQKVDEEVTNAAFISRITDSNTIAKVSLENSNSDPIEDPQAYINELGDASGVAGEGDATRKQYSSNNFITDGDNRKIAIGKLDTQLKTTDDTALNNSVEITNLDGRVTQNETDISQNTSDIGDINSSIGSPNGIASLDSGGKVPLTQLPNSIVEYKGTWDASTNTPTLSDGAPPTNPAEAIGDVYRVSVAGTQDLGSGSITYEIGDYVILNDGYVWERSPSSEAVVSVNGQVGIVVLNADDIDETATRKWDVKNNRNASVDPTVSNDSTEDYVVGSTWFNSLTSTLFVCQDNSAGAAVWVIASGTGGGGDLDVFFEQTFEKDAAADLSKGNNPTFGDSGSFAGTLSDEEVSPISGDRSIKYTQAIGSANDWFYYNLTSIEIEEKQQGKFTKVVFYYSYDGNNSDLVLKFKDQSGVLVDEFELEAVTGKAKRFEAIFSIPETSTSLNIGVQVAVENNGAVLIVDDVYATLDANSMVTVSPVVMRSGLSTTQTGVASKVIPFNDISIDNKGILNTSSGVATIPRDGFYKVVAAALISDLDGITNTRIQIRINSSVQTDCYMSNLAASTTIAYGHVIDVFELSENDTVDIFVVGDASFNIDSTPARTYFSIVEVK
jgi:hypothetical protein